MGLSGANLGWRADMGRSAGLKLTGCSARGPDPEDYAQVGREYGPLPYYAAIEEQADRYRLRKLRN
jgi:hypothetical protein